MNDVGVRDEPVQRPCSERYWEPIRTDRWKAMYRHTRLGFTDGLAAGGYDDRFVAVLPQIARQVGDVIFRSTDVGMKEP